MSCNSRLALPLFCALHDCVEKANRLFGRSCVTGWRLNFHKLALDGSAKCSTSHTGCVEDRAWGILYSIECAQQAALDQAEGLGYAYCAKHLAVVPDGLALQFQASRAAGAGLAPLAAVQALAYIALSLDQTAVPYHWFKQFVLAGAVEHGLPAPYVALIQSAVSQDDPDTERQRTNSAILGVAACV